jgi:hypothetical protein
MAHRAKRKVLKDYLSDFLKLAIFRLSLSSFSNSSFSFSEVIKSLRLSRMIMFAFSKVDRLAIFKKLAKSFAESEPEPSV